MTLLAAEDNLPSQDSTARLRAKGRLYVIFQVVGWGVLLVVGLVVGNAFIKEHPRPFVGLAYVQVTAIGLLLTHFARFRMERWSWKNLDWKQLVPRVITMAAVLAAIWAGLCYLLQRYLLGWPPLPNMSFTVHAAWQWFNCTLIMAGWLCVYFFYHLFDRFNRLEVERLRMATTIKQAELRALKSQLNPHFIFNSLNSLRALIDENPGRAREAVTQLANLLRYSLQSVQLETVPFEDELRVVKDYLALEQVRYEERLRLRLDVPTSALRWPIPPLLLQTLVENAIKYGISTRPEGGEISIVARCDSGTMFLRVTNPGRLVNGAQKNLSTGLGLSNAYERLRLLFGERSSLEVRADGADMVVAEAIIPFQPSKN